MLRYHFARLPNYPLQLQHSAYKWLIYLKTLKEHIWKVTKPDIVEHLPGLKIAFNADDAIDKKDPILYQGNLFSSIKYLLMNYPVVSRLVAMQSATTDGTMGTKESMYTIQP